MMAVPPVNIAPNAMPLRIIVAGEIRVTSESARITAPLATPNTKANTVTTAGDVTVSAAPRLPSVPIPA